MGENPKSQISEKVIVGTVSAIILAALTYLGRSFLLPLLNTTWVFVWSVLKETLAWFLWGTVVCPSWLFCVLVVASFILAVVVASKMRREVKINSPSWMDYTADNFFGIKWRWKYSSDGQYEPCAFCPTDDTVLVYRKEYDRTSFLIGASHAITLHCETCGRQFGPFDGSDYDLSGKVKRQIDRKLRNNEWKSLVKNAEATA